MWPKEKKWVEWLSDKSPDVWHCALRTYEWGTGPHVPAWIVEQPNCDKSTVVAFLAMVELSHYLERPRLEDYPGEEEAIFARVIIESIDRWNAGFYTRDEIRITKEYQRNIEFGRRWADEYRHQGILFEIPDDMENRPGHRIVDAGNYDGEWHDGMSLSTFENFNVLLNEPK